jgi:intron-binding protein aquarius
LDHLEPEKQMVFFELKKVIVKIIKNLYENYKNERTLIITHSNNGLNEILSKLLSNEEEGENESNINESHIIRLGGNNNNEIIIKGKDMSKFGRINYILERRIILLDRIKEIAKEIGEREEFGLTCSSSMQFFEFKIKPLFERMRREKDLYGKFPMKKFLSEDINFTKNDENDLKIIEYIYLIINNIINELKEFSSFEVIKTFKERGFLYFKKKENIY